MLKKLLVFLVLPFLLIPFLCGCQEKSDKTVLTFSSWGSVTETQILENVIKNYENDNPNIKINFLHVPQNYFQKIHLLFASNQAPDVIFINNLYLPVYASKLLDLSDWQNLDDFYPESIKAMSYENKVLAIPRDVSTLVFYRNKTLIPQKPQNLEELINSISKSKYFGISCERNLYFMLPYILTFGEDIYNPQKSLEFYRTLENKYAPSPSEIGSSTLAQMFLAGKIGLYLSGRWLYPKIKECANFDWDVITFTGIVPLDASGWAISKESHNIEEARKFVEYLSSEDTIKYFTQTGLIVPARIDVSKTIDNKVFLDAIKKSRAIDYGKDYKRKTDKMNKKLF